MTESLPPAAPLPDSTWDLCLPRGRTLHVGDRPLVAGILNCTPDSFSDGGLYGSADDAVRAGLEMQAAGADWLDVGGESTRPGAQAVPPAVQLERIEEVIRELRFRTELPISVDTMSPTVGERALEAGADIINDVSGCRDPGWVPVLRRWDVPVVLTHMQGMPADMQENPQYPHGVLSEVLEFFRRRIGDLAREGIAPGRILIDPGVGFGKRVKDNLELIRKINLFRVLGRPIFVGTSRKSFLRNILPPGAVDLDLATTLVNSIVLQSGANVIRVHNVPYANALVKVHVAVRGHSPQGMP